MIQRFADMIQGADKAVTGRSVERFWAAYGARNGFPATGRNTPQPDGRTLNAYVNHSRWVADCPVCNGGLAVNPDMPSGCCLDCGTVYTIRFPTDPDAVERTLCERPNLTNRNWQPGETVDKLISENIIHSVQPLDDISKVT